jgi:hypothetical protein
MKVIIAGSRWIKDMRFVLSAIEQANFPITEVVSGTALGVDKLGESWALQRGIPISRFRANWDQQPKSAGLIRNEHMADYADALIAIWDGKSKGTKHMIWTAQKKGLKVYVFNVTTPERAPLLPSLTTGEDD